MHLGTRAITAAQSARMPAQSMMDP